MSMRLAIISPLLIAGACWVAPRAYAGKVVYANDFEAAAGKEWSEQKIEVTPKDNRHFLGGFTTETITLKLEKLPPHKYIRFTLDLYIMQTWDGNGEFTRNGLTRIGPDYFRMGVEGGVTLIDNSFSNHDFDCTAITKEVQFQSYPSVLAGESFPAKTGAAEKNTLGFEWSYSDRIVRPMDSVYKLSYILPHEAAAIQFNFMGAEGLKTGDDECWGLDNVKVEALEEGDVKKLDDVEMRKLWEAIGGHDPMAETEAFWRLAAGGDDVARFLRGRVKQAEADKAKFARLVKDLDGDDFKLREQATEALKLMGQDIESLLREALEEATSAEVRLRLEAALKGLAKTPPVNPEKRRYAIAMKLLRTIGTDEARKLVRELSGK